MRNQNGKVIFYYPSALYDAMQLAMFPINYLISGMCHLQPSKSVWNAPGYASQDIKGTGVSVNQVRASILNREDTAFNEADLVRLYDSLPAVKAEEDLIGRSWKGKILRTNKSVLDLAEWAVIRPLKHLGVEWGKRYRTAEKGDPLLMRWANKVYFPIPIWGNVGMTDIRWRGEPTATMNYDHQPWKDYFKLLSDENGEIVLLGVWTHKHIAGGWFTLTLDNDTPA